MSLEVVKMSLRDLSPSLFEENFRNPWKPGIITEAINGEFGSNSPWDLPNISTTIGTEFEVVARYYGQGNFDDKQIWQDKGYCQQQIKVTAGQYAEMLQSGTASQEDIYVVSDIAGSNAGRTLSPQFDRLAKQCGLQISAFGPSINAWWGPPGHTEPLHCDIVDTTIWQLHGTKKVILFPPTEWQKLYPFPFESKMSWAFCQVSPSAPDFEKFPEFKEALAKKVEVTIHAGEILYIPICWAHEVSCSGEQHVISVQRFWEAPMSRLAYLPDDVLAKLLPPETVSQLLSKR